MSPVLRPCDQQSYSESPDHRQSLTGLGLINALLPHGRSFFTCISSRITTVIQVEQDPRNNGCCNEPFAASPLFGSCLDMHGLIFETSIWPLAGSTRYLLKPHCSTVLTDFILFVYYFSQLSLILTNWQYTYTSTQLQCGTIMHQMNSKIELEPPHSSSSQKAVHSGSTNLIYLQKL